MSPGKMPCMYGLNDFLVILFLQKQNKQANKQESHFKTNTPIAMYAHIHAIWNVIPGQTAYKTLQKSQSIEIFPVPITLQGD